MIDRKIIHIEAQRRVGIGLQGKAFELGAEWALQEYPRINELALTAFNTAIIRGKIEKDLSHNETFFGIFDELKEFRDASEIDKSEHMPQYTQAQEELADVLICCLTELHRREVDVERIIKEKVEFNKTRDAAGK